MSTNMSMRQQLWRIKPADQISAEGEHGGLKRSMGLLALTMFMGRVGTVTLAAAVAATNRSQHYSLPVERPIVG